MLINIINLILHRLFSSEIFYFYFKIPFAVILSLIGFNKGIVLNEQILQG